VSGRISRPAAYAGQRTRAASGSAPGVVLTNARRSWASRARHSRSRTAHSSPSRPQRGLAEHNRAVVATMTAQSRDRRAGAIADGEPVCRPSARRVSAAGSCSSVTVMVRVAPFVPTTETVTFSPGLTPAGTVAKQNAGLQVSPARRAWVRALFGSVRSPVQIRAARLKKAPRMRGFLLGETASRLGRDWAQTVLRGR